MLRRGGAGEQPATGEQPAAGDEVLVGPDVAGAGAEPVLVSCVVSPGFDFADFRLG